MSRRTALLLLTLTHWGCGPGEVEGGGEADGSTGGETGEETGGDPEPAICGNGVVESGEMCDDGNVLGCDACVECRSYPGEWSTAARWRVWNADADDEHLYLFGGDVDWGLSALSPDGVTLWEIPFEDDASGARDLVALGDRVGLLRVGDTTTRAWVFDEHGLVWSDALVKTWSGARFGDDLAVVDGTADPPQVLVHDVDDGSLVRQFPVGASAQAGSHFPVVMNDWGAGLVVGYTDTSNQQVIAWLDPDGDEVSTLVFPEDDVNLASDPTGSVLVGVRGKNAAVEFTYVDPLGIGDSVSSVAPLNFGVDLHAMDLTSTGQYAALIETTPDFGFFSMHLESDGREILDSRHFGYADDPVENPCSRFGSVIAADAAYIPSEDLEGNVRVTKFRLVE